MHNNAIKAKENNEEGCEEGDKNCEKSDEEASSQIDKKNA
jgi:hypothetical protein